MLKFHPRQPKSSYEARYFARLRDEYQARGPRVLQFPCSQQRPLKRIEPSRLHRNLLHTLTVRNPEFPFSELGGEHGNRSHLKFISRAEHLVGEAQRCWCSRRSHSPMNECRSSRIAAP